jgi:putative methyltransferase (TIGR04325 family)
MSQTEFALSTVEYETKALTYAPIVLFAYKRIAHVKELINSLLENPEAKDSRLIIYSDGPKDGDALAVEEMREHLKTITGFGTVELIQRAYNYGLADNIIAGVTEVLKQFGRAIIVEDDLVVSEAFLSYMNQGLELYADEERVASIHGYIYPIGELATGLPETFFLRGADCWGWATWKRAWDGFDADGAKLLRQIVERDLLYDFDMGTTKGFSQMLLQQVNGRNDSWAIRWHASAFLRNQLTLYPRQSLVRNMGCDGSGTHGESSQANLTLELHPEEINLKRIPVIESTAGKNALMHYFSGETLKTLPPPFGGWFGNFTSYQDAQSYCKGYDAPNILQKVKNAILAVKQGQADGQEVYERDSVVFNKQEYMWSLMTGLYMCAAEHLGALSVIDFGGSLGSTYFQHRNLLMRLGAVSWNVVEQKHFVEVGKQEVAQEGLHFFESVADAMLMATIPPQLMLFSAVLHYLESPLEFLTEMVQKGLPYFIIDRTPVTRFKTRVTVQQVPPVIYEASYPCWIFNEEELLKIVKSRYELVTVWSALDPPQGSFEFRGYLFKLKKD